MWRQMFSASGYLAMFLLPALLLFGVWGDVPYLAFGTVMLVFPLGRGLFGGVKSEEPVIWGEGIATALDRLPLLYAIALPATVLLVLQDVAVNGLGLAVDVVGLGLSFWMTMFFATCIAHDLAHRRDARLAMVGHFIAGLAGYPVLGQEHLTHHARSGDTGNAEWPRLDESVWQFAYRRTVRIFGETYAPGSAFWNSKAHGRRVQGLRMATCVTAATWLLFIIDGGWGGFAVYFGTIVGVTFGVQLITYLQHWGLGDDNLADASAHAYSWEDDCRFQAWITLSLSLHHAHHRDSHLPYYRIAMAPDSPRLPAGYVILMVVCLFPRLWMKLMRPALEHWQREPRNPRSAGRKLTCFSRYDGAKKARAVP